MYFFKLISYTSFNNSKNVHLPYLSDTIVSGIELVSKSKVDTIDFDLEHDLNWMVQSLVSRGYRRIGLFYSGSLEGFNDYFWKRFRQIKRRYGLPCESYDDIAVNWDDTHYNRLKHTFSEIHRRGCCPEALISFFDLRSVVADAIAESGIRLPEKFLFFVQVPCCRIR